MKVIINTAILLLIITMVGIAEHTQAQVEPVTSSPLIETSAEIVATTTVIMPTETTTTNVVEASTTGVVISKKKQKENKKADTATTTPVAASTDSKDKKLPTTTAASIERAKVTAKTEEVAAKSAETTAIKAPEKVLSPIYQAMNHLVLNKSTDYYEPLDTLSSTTTYILIALATLSGIWGLRLIFAKPKSVEPEIIRDIIPEYTQTYKY